MITEETVPTKEARPSRREKFVKKQTAEALAFELLEKVATAVTDAAAPLAVEAREQQSTVHIHIHGGPDLPDIVSSSTVAESATRMRTSSVIGDLPPTAEC